jgi:hypothetical protein
MFSSWIRSGLRVLAAHDQALWGLGLVVVDGGRERPDARWGTVWRAAPGEGGFCNRWFFCLFVVLKWVYGWISKWVARELSGG